MARNPAGYDTEFFNWLKENNKPGQLGRFQRTCEYMKKKMEEWLQVEPTAKECNKVLEAFEWREI
jgi:hypothetical protein